MTIYLKCNKIQITKQINHFAVSWFDFLNKDNNLYIVLCFQNLKSKIWNMRLIKLVLKVINLLTNVWVQDFSSREII